MAQFTRLGNYAVLHYKAELQKLFECCTKPDWMLDAGSGNNGCSLKQIDEDVKFVALDVSRDTIVNGKRNRSQNASFYVVGSVTDLPFKSECFDMVLCSDVLEHVRDKHGSVMELARVSKQYLLGNTTNLFNPPLFLDSVLPTCAAITLANRFAGSGFYERHNRLNPYNLKRMLKQGFGNVRIILLSRPMFFAYFRTAKGEATWLSNCWIMFDKLTRRLKINIFKEMMLFLATK